jgi:hypothetical protein
MVAAMRRIALCAMTALITLLLTLPASAGAPTTVEIDGHITPVLRAFPKRPVPATLSIRLNVRGENGQLSSALTRAVLQFPYGAKLNGSLFPSCSAQMIRDGKKCPAGSKVGSGKALGMLADAKEDITVALYNGPGGKSMTFHLKGDRPAVIDVPFDAPLKTFSGGNYNYMLTVNVPEILQRIVGVDVSLDFFEVKVGATRRAKGRKRGYIETLICPPGALVPVQGSFSFLEAPDFKTDTYIRCGA